MRRIFLTGGTGFIGSHFLAQAVTAGYHITALRRPQEMTTRIPLPAEPCWLDGALSEMEVRHFAGCDTLVHFAGVGVNDPTSCSWEESFQVNVTDMLRLIMVAAEAGVSRMVICGSSFEYGLAAERLGIIPSDAPLEPTGPYAASKAAASLAAHGYAVDKKLEMIILRPFQVFGEGEVDHRFWPSLRRAALDGEDFAMTKGEQVRDFTPVQDVAKVFLNALNYDCLQPGLPLVENIGTGKTTTLLHFAESWWKQWGATGRLLPGAVTYRPNEVMRYIPQVSERCLSWIAK